MGPTLKSDLTQTSMTNCRILLQLPAKFTENAKLLSQRQFMFYEKTYLLIKDIPYR